MVGISSEGNKLHRGPLGAKKRAGDQNSEGGGLEMLGTGPGLQVTEQGAEVGAQNSEVRTWPVKPRGRLCDINDISLHFHRTPCVLSFKLPGLSNYASAIWKTGRCSQ